MSAQILDTTTRSLINRFLLGQLQPGDLDAHSIESANYYDAQDITGTTTSVDFFQSNPAAGLRNWPSANGLTGNAVLVLTHFGFSFETGHTSAGAVLGETTGGAAALTAAFDAWKQWGELARVTFRVGNRNVITEDARSIWCYPAPANAFLSAGTATGFVGFTPGVPLGGISSWAPLGSPFVVFPQESVTCNVRCAVASGAAATNDAVLVARMAGHLIRVANR